MAKLTLIRGLDRDAADKLKLASIRSTTGLLKHASTRKARKQMAQQIGLDESDLLRWVNQADLMRLHGVGGDFAHLLEAAGVDTVAELSRRNAVNLKAALVRLNTAQELVPQLPARAQIEDWIEQAKLLPRVIYY